MTKGNKGRPLRKSEGLGQKGPIKKYHQVAEEFVGLVDAVHLAVAELGLVDAHPVGAGTVVSCN